jgi:hypothetical protein
MLTTAKGAGGDREPRLVGLYGCPCTGCVLREAGAGWPLERDQLRGRGCDTLPPDLQGRKLRRHNYPGQAGRGAVDLFLYAAKWHSLSHSDQQRASEKQAASESGGGLRPTFML